jgi:hypothetical protein
MTSPAASASRIRPASGKFSTLHTAKRTGVGSPFCSANTAIAAVRIATTT